MAWIDYNPNPRGRRTIDCTVRALTKALDCSWDEAYLRIALEGYLQKSMPSENEVWGMVFWRAGFNRRDLPGPCPWCYTVRQFAREHPRGMYVLCTGSHVVTLIDGDWYDTWDSGDETVSYCYVRMEDDHGKL